MGDSKLWSAVAVVALVGAVIGITLQAQKKTGRA